MARGYPVLLFISWMTAVPLVKGSGFPGRHVQVLLLMSFRIQGTPNAKEMEQIGPPFLCREWGVRWARFAIFFLALELGEVCTWGRLEPAFGGNRRGGFCLVRSAEGTIALALVRF